MTVVVLNQKGTKSFELIGTLDHDDFGTKSSCPVLGFDAKNTKQVAKILEGNIFQLETLINSGAIGLTGYLKKHLELIKNLLQKVKEEKKQKAPGSFSYPIQSRYGKNAEWYVY